MPPDLEATGPLFLPREPEGLESPREFASCVHVNEKDKPLYTSRSFTDALRIVQENADPQKAKRNVLIALAEVLRWVHLKLKWSRELDPYVKVVLLHSSGWSKSLRTRAIINGGPSVVWDEDHRRQLTFPLPMDLAEHGAHFRMRLEVFDEQLSRDNLLGLRSRDISVLTAVAAPVEEEWKVFDTMNEQAGSVRFSYHLDVPEDHPPIRCLDPSLADARSNASKSPRARPSDDIFMQQGVGGEEGDAPGASESSSMARSVSSPPRVPNRGQPQNRRGNAEAAAQEMSSSSRSVVLESPKLAAIRTEEAGAGARAEDEPRVSRSAWAGGGSAARPRRKSNLVSVFRNDAVKQPLPPHMQAKLVVEMKSAHELHSRMMQVRVDRKLAKLAVVASIAYFVMGWLFYSFVEGWSFVQCLYFSVVTLTTTGYGDLHPTNNVSKLFTCMFAFCGIGVITSALGLIGGYLFEEQSRAILETMAVMKMHNQDRSHILTFRPKDQTNDRPGNDSPFRMAISATQRGIGLTPPPASPKSPFEGKTGLGWAILRGARKVTPLAGTTFKKMVQRKDLDMTPRREAVTEDSGDGGVSLKKVVAYTWSIVVMIFVGVLMFKFHDGYTFVDAFYLSCISLATVGYGDINPGNNPSSQLFTSVWLLMGTVVIAKAIGGALTYVLDTSRRDIMMNSVNVQALDAKKLLLMDEDGDGVITRIEFLTRMLVKMNKVTTNDIKGIMDTFDELDKDGSGTLTEDDIVHGGDSDHNWNRCAPKAPRKMSSSSMV